MAQKGAAGDCCEEGSYGHLTLAACVCQPYPVGLRDAGTAIVLVSEDLPELFAMSDSLTVLAGHQKP